MVRDERTDGGRPRHERYNVSDPGLLESDTWGETEAACPSCGAAVGSGATRCAACGQWLEQCPGSCPTCPSPRCVGGRRTSR